MKKCIKLMSFLLAIMLFGTSVVLGYEDETANVCTIEKKNNVMREARAVVVDYERTTKEEYVGYDFYTGTDGMDVTNYLNLKIYNVTPNMGIRVYNETTDTYVMSGDSNILTYKNMKSDGTITIEKPLDQYINNYLIEIYGLNECMEERVRVLKYTLPAYNVYSDLDICADVQDFYLCQPLITSPIKKDIDIQAAVANYKEQQVKNGLRKEEESNNTPKISQIITNTSKKKIGFVIVLLAIGSGITVFILYRRKNGAK
jgi:hypothetical protein